MAARADTRSWKDHVGVLAPAMVVTLAGFIFAYQFVDPAPPKRITLATGGVDGAYYLYGQRYKELLQANGIELEVRATAGSLENLRLLEAGSDGADVAFVQGGTGEFASGEELLGLASLYFEPLWVFYRADAPVDDVTVFRDRRLAVGAEGSGSRAVAMTILADNGISESSATLLPLGGHKAADALIGGEVDAVFLVASPDSPSVKALLDVSNIRLMNFKRAAAYSRIHRFLSAVTLPEGVINMSANVPAGDVALLAPAATLVASPSLHPALVDLLLQAADEVHGGGGLFEKRGEFPSEKYLEFPLSPDARRYFKSGPPFLQRFLPFWVATFIDRMLVMLLPLVALAIPLMRIMPPVLRWRIRSRIFRWYRELLAIDPALRGEADRGRLQEYMAAIDRMEKEVSRVEVPLSYADQLYHLRLHINLVRGKLEDAIAAKRE
ncbi:MAG TPA: TAXI family TRAP transporter solute-binding subunit [Gammaproteobacteria bacterium]|nr:TAXI family TRAP transporter solute-binding subunit [Gammaproteobacteria bacterium]